MIRRCTACLMALAMLLIAASALGDRYAPYEFDLDYVPVWGGGDYLTGTVYSAGSRCAEEGLCVKVFLQVEGNDTWWPKPTSNQPWEPVDPWSGDFSIRFNTGGDDIHAVRLALMLVREKDAGLLDFAEAEAESLTVTTIDRTPEGEISLAFSYRADAAWLPEIGINVGFYTVPGTKPGDPLSDEQLRRVLQAAAAYTCDIRLYSVTGDVARAYPMARDLGLRVAATAWLEGTDHDREELDALIALCNSGLASTAFVGNEAVFSGKMTAETLAEDIAYVRAGITNPEIPVTTAEAPDVLMESAAIRDACDILAVNVYPYWNGVAPEDMEADLESVVEAILAVAGGKQLIISETGWPTKGSDRAGDSGFSDALWYARELPRKTDQAVRQVYLFSLADEPWKDASEPGVGGHWGLLDSDLNAKPTVYEFYWNWSPENDYLTTKNI